jgi:hypothetical protein
VGARTMSGMWMWMKVFWVVKVIADGKDGVVTW